MTSESRFERGLSAILEDLYLGPTPDYRDEVMAVATAGRQRPAWTFPGRWIPMADFAGRSAFVPRVPWRSIGVALLIIALLAIAVVAYVGSRPVRVPPPFGPARNGLIAYAADGDVFTGDPVTGATSPIVVGNEIDGLPTFSRDGTRIAFLRQVLNSAGSFQLAVVDSAGGTPTILSTAPFGHPDEALQWSADGTSILVNTPDARLIRFDATGKVQPLVLATGVHVQAGAFRPPDGAQILYQPDGISGTALWVMNADGSGKRSLLERGSEQNGGAISGHVAWSPDGRLIAFGLSGDHDSYARIHVMNADGTGLRRLDKEPGVWVDTDLVWSPDATRIAFNRWLQNGGGGFDIQPIGIVPVGGGPVVDAGPTPVSDGASFDWSPDGASIVSIPGTILAPNSTMTGAKPTIIDAVSGQAHELDMTMGSATSWQRLAP